MDRRVGITLAVALGLALMAIAFLLGRESQRGTPAALAPTAGPAGVVPGAAAPAPAEGDPPPEQTVPESGPGSAAAPFSAVPEAATPATAGPASAPDDAVRARVARYFADVEAMQQASKGWSGEPQAAAQQMLREAVSGNTEGFRSMGDATRKLAEQLRALPAPEPCVPHQQKTLEVLDLAGRVLDKMRSGLESGDMGALGAMANDGQELERRTREVDALAASIKKRYGL